ncbi:hypothetical protein E2320_002010 [Naja naja]|nr:hypothetical protein E2320_002010 [Naja naja]
MPYTILNILKNCNIEKALEQSAGLLITEADEIKNNNSVKLCFWKQTKKYCNTTFSVRNTACPENFDIRIHKKKIEKSTLVSSLKALKLIVDLCMLCLIKKNPHLLRVWDRMNLEVSLM